MPEVKDITKSVEETVNQILATETVEVQKAMPMDLQANGGEDKLQSGSPMTEEQKAEEAKKAKAAEDEEEEKKRKEKEDSEKEDEAKKAKSEEKESEDEDKDEKEEDEPKKSKMKKSIEDLAEHLDEEELELVKTWREECEKETVAKSQAAPAPAAQPDMSEILKKAVSEGTADIRKALDEKDTLIKGLSEKIEKMASQPAYDRRSISTLETLEKSNSQENTISKSQVLDKMLEMQAAGKGVTSHHIAEFESCNNISNRTIKEAVFKELKLI